jgi:hypothetical protein
MGILGSGNRASGTRPWPTEAFDFNHEFSRSLERYTCLIDVRMSYTNFDTSANDEV